MTPTGKLPLFLVSGASCVGKSSLCEVLFRREQDFLVLESDLLWRKEFDTPEEAARKAEGWIRTKLGRSYPPLVEGGWREAPGGC